jgi:lactate dehydrogenase-like 2-hydroxyacid dehydrogenase
MIAIEVNDEQLNDLVVADLLQSLQGLKRDLKEGRGGIWSHDPKEDRKMIQKHIKALTLIIGYYGGDA